MRETHDPQHCDPEAPWACGPDGVDPGSVEVCGQVEGEGADRLTFRCESWM